MNVVDNVLIMFQLFILFNVECQGEYNYTFKLINWNVITELCWHNTINIAVTHIYLLLKILLL